MSAEAPDRREAARLPRIESVSIELRPGDGTGEARPRVLSTQTVDLSAQGMRIRLPIPVENDCLLDLCVELQGHSRPFLLAGESRWCQRLEDGSGFEAGLRIYDAEGTDYPDWTALFVTAPQSPGPS